MSRKKIEPPVTHTDVDGREWAQDNGGIWYSPSHGLEFDTFEELDNEYGPIKAVSES